MVRPAVVAGAKREFADDLRERGFTDVMRGKRQRIRVETGERALLTKFSARYRIDPIDVADPNTDGSDEPRGGTGTGNESESDGDDSTDRPQFRSQSRDFPIAGWTAVWVRRSEFRLAGGAYPAAVLGDVLGVDDDRLDLDPAAVRDTLLELIRAVR